MRTDRQTDMAKVAVSFRNFSKAPKKETESLEPNRRIMSSTYELIMLRLNTGFPWIYPPTLHPLAVTLSPPVYFTTFLSSYKDILYKIC